MEERGEVIATKQVCFCAKFKHDFLNGLKIV